MPESLDLDRLEALANAATPGPWTADALEGYLYSGVAGGLVATVTMWRDADAEFIAAAREGVPELIAEVRRLRDLTDDLASNAEANWESSRVFEAERDALAAKVSAVEAILSPEWRTNLDRHTEYVEQVRAIRAALNHTGATTPESAAAGPETGIGGSGTPSGHTDAPPEIPGPQIGAQR